MRLVPDGCNYTAGQSETRVASDQTGSVSAPSEVIPARVNHQRPTDDAPYARVQGDDSVDDPEAGDAVLVGLDVAQVTYVTISLVVALSTVRAIERVEVSTSAAASAG